jgi:hypothetical protein
VQTTAPGGKGALRDGLAHSTGYPAKTNSSRLSYRRIETGITKT